MGSEIIREECGVFAVVLKKDISYYPKGGAAYYVYKGLLAEQSRGQLSAGTTRFNANSNKKLITHKGIGLVKEVFFDNTLNKFYELQEYLSGTAAIGHVRYATSGSRDETEKSRELRLLSEAQPFERKHGKRWKHFAMAFNGNLTNYDELKKELEEKKEYDIETSVDTELIMHIFSRSIKKLSDKINGTKPTLEDVVSDATKNLEGAYAIVYLNAYGDIGFIRDPLGFKPLCYGENEDIIACASESTALTQIGIDYKDIHPILPGELISIENKKLNKHIFAVSNKISHCYFEWVYFSRTSSFIDGILCDDVRRNLGVELAKIEPLKDKIKLDDSYVISYIPNTSRPCAEALAYTLGIPLVGCMEKNHGRTFIENKEQRELTVNDKYTYIPGILKGKKVLLVDDSIVRGTTITRIIEKVKSICGAKEIHMRSSCPPIVAPCFYGIDFPTKKELIALKYASINELEEQLSKIVGADSLKYQTKEGLLSSIGLAENKLCLACITKKYPTAQGQKLYSKQ